MAKRKADTGGSVNTRDVMHGCVDCLHYETPLQKPPCKNCSKWSLWEKNEEKVKALEARIKEAKQQAEKAAKGIPAAKSVKAGGRRKGVQ